VIYTPTQSRAQRSAAQDHQDAGHFPSDDAATKLIWLALRNITADWGRAAKDWKEAMNQFAISMPNDLRRPEAKMTIDFSPRRPLLVLENRQRRRRGKVSFRFTHRNSDTPSLANFMETML